MSPSFLGRVKARITYANVVSTVCLFVVLGGTGYAAATGSIDSREIKNNTILSKDIQTGAVASSDVKDGALQSEDFKAGGLPAGPPGATGPQGAPGATDIVVRRADVVPAAAPATSILSVGCSAGESLVGGGVVRVTSDGVWSQHGTDAVQISAPAAPGAVPSGEGETPEEWLSAFHYQDAPDAGERIRHYAICARP